jgi:hypothetical protein
VRSALLGVGAGLAAVLSGYALLWAYAGFLALYTPGQPLVRSVVAVSVVSAVVVVTLAVLPALLYRLDSAKHNVYVAVTVACLIVGVAAYPGLLVASVLNDCMLSVDFPLPAVHACER